MESGFFFLETPTLETRNENSFNTKAMFIRFYQVGEKTCRVCLCMNYASQLGLIVLRHKEWERPKITCGSYWLLHWYQTSWGFPDHTRDSGSGFLPRSCRSAESSSGKNTKKQNSIMYLTLLSMLL